LFCLPHRLPRIDRCLLTGPEVATSEGQPADSWFSCLWWHGGQSAGLHRGCVWLTTPTWPRVKRAHRSDTRADERQDVALPEHPFCGWVTMTPSWGRATRVFLFTVWDLHGVNLPGVREILLPRKDPPLRCAIQAAIYDAATYVIAYVAATSRRRVSGGWGTQVSLRMSGRSRLIPPVNGCVGKGEVVETAVSKEQGTQSVRPATFWQCMFSTGRMMGTCCSILRVRTIIVGRPRHVC